jgi:indolepyruvate ferredoxin oxidoreductase alpha subunit
MRRSATLGAVHAARPPVTCGIMPAHQTPDAGRGAGERVLVSCILLSGNEAIARGAWEAGAIVGVGYPGTPSTETLEAFVKLPNVIAEWAPNEKVALEVGAGVSLAGGSVLVTMKHVGLNVAADPLFTLAYTGVGGAMVVLVADDPGMHSSQNEQDSRNYAAFARVPLFEPSDSAEALLFTKHAFEVSERFDTPVLIRSTTRISHSKSMCETGERFVPAERTPYETRFGKWVMLPANAKARRVELDSRVAELVKFSDETDVNRVEQRDSSVGVITSGVVYQYVREALPDASILKLGMSFPLPAEKIRAFADSVDRLYVAEEADAYIARGVRALCIEVEPSALPVAGELSPGAIRRAFGVSEPPARTIVEGLPPRPPLMCPGCPHRPVFYALRRIKAVVSGDIGCYTLGALAPLSAMDTCVCMGASISMAHGVELAGGTGNRPVVAVIGDSTFAHSGITGLANTVYNGGGGTVIILDNRITAMTGHQGNPVNGRTLDGGQNVEMDLEALARALGVRRVRTIDPHDVPGTEAAIREEVAADELSVIITKAPCALLVRDFPEPYAVDTEACTACGLCIRLGCPAIAKAADGKADIDTSICVGCAQCVQVCRFDAIVHSGPACDLGGV